MSASQPPEVMQLPLTSIKGNRSCPFCGGTSLSSVAVKGPEPLPLCIQCDTCGATGPIAVPGLDLEMLWNTRANQSA
ncbi:hypothetical protein [Stenotrophomonas sp.]|uniref:hypothetical protein n=1 Tax=Stenotrophomonas sp. TaxID=69392 RepID=UPI0028A91774|nr:hypothetical protein [Stenotrophomonas sp.]